MNLIYKYPITERMAGTTLLLPKDAEILTARYQNNDFGNGVMLYAKVNVTPGTPKVQRCFYVLATGEEVPPGCKYIATIEKPSGIILHVFEKPLD